jgi:hypothetical protein
VTPLLLAWRGVAVSRTVRRKTKHRRPAGIFLSGSVAGIPLPTPHPWRISVRCGFRRVLTSLNICNASARGSPRGGWRWTFPPRTGRARVYPLRAAAFFNSSLPGGSRVLRAGGGCGRRKSPQCQRGLGRRLAPWCSNGRRWSRSVAGCRALNMQVTRGRN